MAPRTFARHGSAAFNDRLNDAMERLASDVRDSLRERLTALVLGGGYGRGEGGVVLRDGVEHPYNDLDLTLVVGKRDFEGLRSLPPISEKYAAGLGIHVDFSRPLTEGDVRSWPHWLMWTDLLHGHMVLWGEPDILRHLAPAEVWGPPPPEEALRLLLNRGAGLLWAARVTSGVEPEPDGDFVRRNTWKCVLSLGDALLLAARRYATMCEGRGAALSTLAAEDPEVAALGLQGDYDSAIRFKLAPDELPSAQPDIGSLARVVERWDAVLRLTESRRTGMPFPDRAAYRGWRGIREPVLHRWRARVRNAAINLRRGAFSTRYPRESLYTELPALLDPAAWGTAGWAASGGRFLGVWRRFN